MPRKPSTKQRIINELMTVNGIGPKTAAKIYDKCGGKNCLENLEDDPDAVAAKAGLTPQLIQSARLALKPRAFGRRPGMARSTVSLEDEQEIRRELSKHWNALQRQKRYCELVLAKHRARLMARPDVNGVHVGLWRKGGKVVCPLQYCIRVHVADKLEITDETDWLLAANSLMPTPIESSLDGVRVDVLAQSYQPIAALPSQVTKRFDKLLGGIAISRTSDPDNWGTLGMPVLGGDLGFLRYLTNAHVVGTPGSRVQQPPSSAADPGAEIGTVDVSIHDQTLDAALIRPDRGSGKRKAKRDVLGVSGSYIDGVLTDADRTHGTDVFKVGATTGPSPRIVGRVKNVNATVEVNNRKMTKQILIEADQRIIEPGDSGSVLIVKVSPTLNKVVGLVHAQTVTRENGQKREGFGLVASHMSEIRSRLNLSI